MLQPVFTPFPELTTERLLLRKISLADAPEIYFLRSDPAILQFISKEPAANINEAIQFISRINTDIQTNEAIMWAIVLKKNPAKTLGNICFWRLQKNITGQNRLCTRSGILAKRNHERSH
ncbi:MAG: GNAT family N-acetyltransferase [Chitinophagaceae bacterium]|nr:GNAT family N-acetyltransferase [Chitinophagaceae bacterium]